MSKPLFGIGVEEDDNLDALLNSKHPKHPANIEDKVNQILEYVEQMQITTRDNNAILHQLMRTMEERVNRKIDDLRTEMIELIQKTAAAPSNSASPSPVNIPLPSPPKAAAGRRASAFEMRSKPVAQPAAQTADEAYEMVSITPRPGFVVKTRKLIGEKNKVFINIFHHEQIALNPPGLALEKAIDKPYMMMEDPTTAVDHAGVNCMTFNVGISSEYFTQPNPKVDINITAPVTIYKVCYFPFVFACDDRP